MINKYPCFILKQHVVAFIEDQEPDFAKQLTNPSQSFSYGGAYFAPAMSGYVVRIPFGYVPMPSEFGAQIFKDFHKMKKNETVKMG